MNKPFDKFEQLRCIKVEFNTFENGDIEILTDFYGQQRLREVIHTKEVATRAALIQLGWTPPEEKK